MGLYRIPFDILAERPLGPEVLSTFGFWAEFPGMVTCLETEGAG